MALNLKTNCVRRFRVQLQFFFIEHTKGKSTAQQKSQVELEEAVSLREISESEGLSDEFERFSADKLTVR